MTLCFFGWGTREWEAAREQLPRRAERRRALFLLHCSHAALLRFEVQRGEGCEPLSSAQTLPPRARRAFLIERGWSVLRLEQAHLIEPRKTTQFPPRLRVFFFLGFAALTLKGSFAGRSGRGFLAQLRSYPPIDAMRGGDAAAWKQW